MIKKIQNMRRTQIKIETHSITVIRVNGETVSTKCEICRENVPAFSPEQIAQILQLDLAEVCRRIETKEIHLTGNGRGAALVCGSTLKVLETFKTE